MCLPLSPTNTKCNDLCHERRTKYKLKKPLIKRVKGRDKLPTCLVVIVICNCLQYQVYSWETCSCDKLKVHLLGDHWPDSSSSVNLGLLWESHSSFLQQMLWKTFSDLTWPNFSHLGWYVSSDLLDVPWIRDEITDFLMRNTTNSPTLNLFKKPQKIGGFSGFSPKLLNQMSSNFVWS